MKVFPRFPKRILIIKTHAIGDTILITPAITILRNIFQKSHIVLLTGNIPKEIIEGNRDIDEILSIDESALFRFNFSKIIELIRVIRRRKFDLVFIFHYSFAIHLLAFLFGIPIRIGFNKSGSGLLLTHKVQWENNKDRWIGDIYLDLVRLVNANVNCKKLNIVISDDEMEFADSLLADNQIQKSDPLIGIFPGGGKNVRDTVNQKQWKTENYVKLIDQILKKFEVKFIVFGSHNDEKVVSNLVKLSMINIVNTCNTLNLKQLSAMIKKCSLLITNDSAPLHIAIAMNTPTVSLFGPSWAKALVEENDIHIVIQSKYPCSPCYSNSPFPGCDNPMCMDAIDCNEVITCVERQLRKLYSRNII